MPEIKQNGAGFQYILQFKREGFPDENVDPVPIDNWRTYEYFHNAPNQIYEPYEIILRARNSVGFARQDPAIIRGFTGEASKSMLIHYEPCSLTDHPL